MPLLNEVVKPRSSDLEKVPEMVVGFGGVKIDAFELLGKDLGKQAI